MANPAAVGMYDADVNLSAWFDDTFAKDGQFDTDYIFTSSVLAPTKIVGTSSVSANLAATGVLASAIIGTASISANIQATGVLASSITGVASVSANLAAKGVLASAIAGVGTVSAAPQASGVLAGAITGVATVSANLTATGALAGAILGTSSVSASIGAKGVLASAVTGAASVSGTLLASGVLASAITGDATVSAGLTATGALASAIAGDATISALPSASGILASDIDGTATVVADLLAFGALDAGINGNAVIEADLVNAATGAIQASIAGVGSVAALITQPGAIFSSIAGASSVTGELLGAGTLASGIFGQSSTLADGGEIKFGASDIFGSGFCSGYLELLVPPSGPIPVILSTFGGISSSNPAVVSLSSGIKTFSQPSFVATLSTPYQTFTPDGWGNLGQKAMGAQLLVAPNTGSLNGKIYFLAAQGFIYVPALANATFSPVLNNNNFYYDYASEEIVIVPFLMTQMASPISLVPGVNKWTLSCVLAGNGKGQGALSCQWVLTVNGVAYKGRGFQNWIPRQEAILQFSMGVAVEATQDIQVTMTQFQMWKP